MAYRRCPTRSIRAYDDDAGAKNVNFLRFLEEKMLTPSFELSQDEKFVYVYIKTPYIKISELEYFIEEYQFKFYVKPYFLRLNLPGKIVENGEESASYDVEKGLFTVHLPKLVPGFYFQDLDLLTKLLAPSGRSNVCAPVIEVVSDDPASKDEQGDELNFDWEWDQEICDEEKGQQLSICGMKYGFGNQKSGIFYQLKDELKEIIDNPNPDELSFSERRLSRITAEDAKFDVEYYLADYFDGERIQDVLNYVVQEEQKVLLTEEEKEKLRQLPNKEYLLDDKDEMSAFFSLVDIMFAFAYNKRTMLGENTVESAWTISKLSPTLSWFESFTNLKDVLLACCRRSLAYPLYRHWELSCKVMQDVKDILHLGRRKILQCLLEILKLFNASEPRYLLNELYITDYCIWIQKVKEKKVESLVKKFSQTKIRKEDIGWDLDDSEAAATMVYEEHKMETPQSDTELSSSEQSSDTEDETTCDDDSDKESVEEVKDCEVCSEVSYSVPQCSKTEGDIMDGNLKCCHEGQKPQSGSCEKCSSDNTLGNIEILPSLLFGKNRDGAKKLIEVVADEKDETEDNVLEQEGVCGGPCEEEIVDERSHEGDGRTAKDRSDDDNQYYQSDLRKDDDDLRKDDNDLRKDDNDVHQDDLRKVNDNDHRKDDDDFHQDDVSDLRKGDDDIRKVNDDDHRKDDDDVYQDDDSDLRKGDDHHHQDDDDLRKVNDDDLRNDDNDVHQDDDSDLRKDDGDLRKVYDKSLHDDDNDIHKDDLLNSNHPKFWENDDDLSNNKDNDDFHRDDDDDDHQKDNQRSHNKSEMTDSDKNSDDLTKDDIVNERDLPEKILNLSINDKDI